jgi:hypothetical protein
LAEEILLFDSEDAVPDDEADDDDPDELDVDCCLLRADVALASSAQH